MTQDDLTELRQLLRDSEARLTAQITDVKTDIASVRQDAVNAAKLAADAAKFGDNAQGAAKLLGFILGILVAAATIYGAFH